jgi:hypothetical protein
MFRAVQICNFERKTSKRLIIIAKNVKKKLGKMKKKIERRIKQYWVAFEHLYTNMIMHTHLFNEIADGRVVVEVDRGPLDALPEQLLLP